MKTFDSLIETSTRTTLVQDRQIKQVISRIVPASTLSHVQFCRLEGGRLRVTVDSAAWVARLRFTERQLIGVLKAEKWDVHTVSFHVSPSEVPVRRTTLRQANSPSSAAASALQALADAEQSAPEVNPYVKSEGTESLRQELLKLAEKLRNT